MKKFLLGFFFLVTLVGIVSVMTLPGKINAAPTVTFLEKVPSGSPVHLYTGESNPRAYCIGFATSQSNISLTAGFLYALIDEPQSSVSADGLTLNVSSYKLSSFEELSLCERRKNL